MKQILLVGLTEEYNLSFLENYDYEVMQVDIFERTANAALSLTEKKYDYCVIDKNIEGFSWTEFAELVRRVNPETAVLILFDETNTQDELELIQENGNLFSSYGRGPKMHLAYLEGEQKNRKFMVDSTLSLMNNYVYLSPKVIVDFSMKLVSVDGREVKLTNNECLLLKELYVNRNQVVLRSELFIIIHPSGTFPLRGRGVDVHVGKLRSKIGHSFIQTVRNEGYMLHSHQFDE